MSEYIEKGKDMLKEVLSMRTSSSEVDLILFYFIISAISLFVIYIIFKFTKTEEYSDNEVFETQTEDLEYVAKEIKAKELKENEIQLKENQAKELKAKEAAAEKFHLESTFNEIKSAIEEPKVEVIESFEIAQEEESIISYSELKEKTSNETEEIEIYEFEPEPQMESLENTNTYKRSDFISPIYGVQDEYIPKHKKEKPSEIKVENPNIQEAKEIKKEVIVDKKETSEFLNSLKELRQNLK